MNQDLHDAIMRLHCDPASGYPAWQWSAYHAGHRDARHAAAELVIAALTVELTDAYIVSLAYDCNALPEVITDETLLIFARAVLASQKAKNEKN